MTVEELIETLSSLDLGAQVLIRFTKEDAYGSRWKDLTDFDELDVKVNGHTLIIDISNKQKIPVYISNKTYYNNFINWMEWIHPVDKGIVYE